MSTARRFLVALLVVAVTTIPAQRAQAHSTLVAACPGPGEVMSILETIELRFSGPLDATEAQPPKIALATEDGRTDLEIGPTMVDLNVLVASVPVPPDPGSYTVRYEALSFDGALNDGGYQFTYDPAAKDPGNCRTEGAEAGGSGAGIWLFVGTGVVALLAMGLWLRQRGAK